MKSFNFVCVVSDIPRPEAWQIGRNDVSFHVPADSILLANNKPTLSFELHAALNQFTSPRTQEIYWAMDSEDIYKPLSDDINIDLDVEPPLHLPNDLVEEYINNNEELDCVAILKFESFDIHGEKFEVNVYQMSLKEGAQLKDYQVGINHTAWKTLPQIREDLGNAVNVIRSNMTLRRNGTLMQQLHTQLWENLRLVQCLEAIEAPTVDAIAVNEYDLQVSTRSKDLVAEAVLTEVINPATLKNVPKSKPVKKDSVPIFVGINMNFNYDMLAAVNNKKPELSFLRDTTQQRQDKSVVVTYEQENNNNNNNIDLSFIQNSPAKQNPNISFEIDKNKIVRRFK